MNEDSKTNSVVKLPTFKGGKDQWNMYWPKIRAYMRMKGLQEALNPDFELPDDPENLTGTDSEKKAQKKNIVLNNAAVAVLTVSFDHPELIRYCTESETEEYPGGIAREIVRKLFSKYRPIDCVAEVEAELDLTELRFKSGRNPEEYFTDLALLRNQYKDSKKFKEKSLVASTVAKAPKMYSGTLASELRRQGDGITLQHINDCMVDLY